MKQRDMASPAEPDTEPEPHQMPSELQLLFFLLKVFEFIYLFNTNIVQEYTKKLKEKTETKRKKTTIKSINKID